ncbi:hypothetical protein EW145_g4296 [Phellinidium pouzarii]|uniref:Uncharacterized protein n=1 Tax=Phellinidium pouzarii TaxID=167371 RepID=A0A4S4L492_9AGAM|nr:hypothetical protein EW145_g4296 [Phellinidium pouzarii]
MFRTLTRFPPLLPNTRRPVFQQASKSVGTMTQNNAGKVWVITGSSSGLGRLFAEVVLAQGDRVIATARNIESLRDLLQSDTNSEPRIHLLQLDVTSPFSTLQEAAAVAVDKWGRIDVLVNNAAAGMAGISEEVGLTSRTHSAFVLIRVEGYQRQFATNFFGALNVTYAFLPYMRSQRSGTIVFIGSRSSWRSDVPMLGSYSSSKAALTAAAEALSVEVAPLNIRVLNVLPGGLRTPNWDNMVLLPTAPSALLPISPVGAKGANQGQSDVSPAAKPVDSAAADARSVQHDSEQHIADYAELRARRLAWMYAQTGAQPGDPGKSAQAIVDIVNSADGSGEGTQKRGWPDLNMLVLGSDAEANIREKCARVLQNLDDWADVVKSIDID